MSDTPTPSAAQAAEPIANRQQRRTALAAFIQEHLLAGVHFSTIHRKVGGQFCPNRDKPDSWQGCDACKQRPSLRQPGSERIVDYFGHQISQPVLARDVMDTVKLGTQLPTVAFRIELTDANGRVVGHGIGACSHEDLNIALKKAKKNALIDAVRTAYALSDMFRDGGEEEGGDTGSRGSAPPPADGAPRRAGRPAGAPPAAAPPAAPPAAPQAGATAPARAATAQPAAPPAPVAPPPPAGAPPGWWSVGKDIPGAMWNVTAKDGATHPCQGCIHFPPAAKALIGPPGREWNFYSPNAQGKPEFKTKPPWTLWAQMTWHQLLEYALEHRAKHQAAGEETNKFNDPFVAILTDTYATVYNGTPTPVAEMAAGMDKIAWMILAKRREKAGGAPATPPAAAAPPPPPPPPPAPAPAPAAIEEFVV